MRAMSRSRSIPGAPNPVARFTSNTARRATAPRPRAAPNWQERDANGELPAPPHNAEGHTWRHSDADLYKMVSNGWRDPFNKSMRLTMPAFGGVLSPDQIRAVITYLKTLWTPEQTRFQSEESQGHSFPSAGK